MVYTRRVEPKKRGRGRPPKPEGERYVMGSFRFPPDLWRDVIRWIPKGQRSAIVTTCLRRAIARRQAEAQEKERESE